MCFTGSPGELVWGWSGLSISARWRLSLRCGQNESRGKRLPVSTTVTVTIPLSLNGALVKLQTSILN
jgi:hypothetical protein